MIGRGYLAMRKFARYGPPPRYGLPEAGFCASSFAIIRAGERLLLGVPNPTERERWQDKWWPGLAFYPPRERDREIRLWRFPAAFLYEGESPGDCLERVMKDMLGVPEWSVTDHEDRAFYDPSDWYPGHRHYDLCFVYRVTLPKEPMRPAWFSRLEFVDPTTVGAEDFGSSQGDLARALNLVTR
jgi:hypothetical protein